MGSPVVASRTGGIPEVDGDGETALLVTHGDVAELSNALRRVVEDPLQAARMGRAPDAGAPSPISRWEGEGRRPTTFVATLDRTAPIPGAIVSDRSQPDDKGEWGRAGGAASGPEMSRHSRRGAERWQRGFPRWRCSNRAVHPKCRAASSSRGDRSAALGSASGDPGHLSVPPDLGGMWKGPSRSCPRPWQTGSEDRWK